MGKLPKLPNIGKSAEEAGNRVELLSLKGKKVRRIWSQCRTS